MGLFGKLFGDKSDRDMLTDDEKELREYEENVYRAESGVTDSCHAEFIISGVAPTTNNVTIVKGSVTEGTFKSNDNIKIILRNGQEITSRLISISVHLLLSETATEGQSAEFLIDTPDTKLIKRNDIIKKIIPE